jgi:hypothetical protein
MMGAVAVVACASRFLLQPPKLLECRRLSGLRNKRNVIRITFLSAGAIILGACCFFPPSPA